jgi:glucose-1-phosphate cytidylyltransferase
VKVIILAGGLGTRLSEYTESIPKPMVTVGGKPIVWHVMKRYAKYGHKDFFLALGYKSEYVKDYFLNYRSLNTDFSIDLSSGKFETHHADVVDWNVTLVQTGLKTMTGGRVKRLQSFIGNETCMLTYGDGVADVDIDQLLKFHRSHGKMVTMTAVHPMPRFGELELDGDKVVTFMEKPNMGDGWINGGFCVIEPRFFDLIEGDTTILERAPFEKASELGELMAFKHDRFWHCMDTKRDRDVLEELYEGGNAPWVV